MRLIFILLSLAYIPCHAQTHSDYEAFLVKVEGYVLAPYNHGTHVGIGHLLQPGEKRGLYTAAQVEVLFTNDLNYAIVSCQQAFQGFDTLPHDVKMVLVSLSFSVGRTGLLRFHHLRTAIKYRRYEEAALEIINSRWYRQVSHERGWQAYQILHAHS